MLSPVTGGISYNQSILHINDCQDWLQQTLAIGAKGAAKELSFMGN
jgi:hypothetical protein